MFGFAQPITAQDADVCVHLRLCRMVLRDHVLVTFFLRVLVFPLNFFFQMCTYEWQKRTMVLILYQ